MTIQVHDTKEIIEWAKKALGEGENEAKKFLDEYKRRIILQTAQKLEETGMEKSKICTVVVEGLQDMVGESWIRKNLPPEYKSQEHRDSILKRYSHPKKVEGLSTSTKSEHEDAALALSRARPEADITNGETEDQLFQKTHKFSPDEWQPDMFDFRLIDDYKDWQLRKTLRYGFSQLGWTIR